VVLGLFPARVTSSRKIKATWLESCLNFFQPVGVKVMLKKRVVAAVAAALLAGSASAVTVNPEGTGDFLIAPAYFIGGGLKTHLQIINTNATQSTVAKLVFRDRTTSAELLDFLIYLSPNDVWNGTIQCNAADAAGTCTSSSVVSNDESSEVGLSGSGFLFEARNDATTGRAPFPNEGYVDVEMGPVFALAEDQRAQNKAGVSKAAVRAAYDARVAAGNFLLLENETPNILTGVSKVEIPGFGAASIPLVALADYNTSVLPRLNVASGLDAVTNSALVADVEEAIWKNAIAVPYKLTTGGFSLVSFTFPTKLSYNDRRDGQYAFPERASATAAHTCLQYTTQYYDTEEQTRQSIRLSPPTGRPNCATEFDFKLFGVSEATTFQEGWARFTFSGAQVAAAQTRVVADSRNTGRAGIPVISTYMIRGGAGDLTWAYSPSSR
jgi:hypothetical protein